MVCKTNCLKNTGLDDWLNEWRLNNLIVRHLVKSMSDLYMTDQMRDITINRMQVYCRMNGYLNIDWQIEYPTHWTNEWLNEWMISVLNVWFTERTAEQLRKIIEWFSRIICTDEWLIHQMTDRWLTKSVTEWNGWSNYWRKGLIGWFICTQ